MGKYPSTANRKIGIKRRNSYKKMIKSLDVRHTEANWYISTITDVFLHQKRVNICKHTVKMPHAHGAIFTVCSHTFTLFRLRKTSVIVKTYQLPCVYWCLLSRDLFIFSVRVSSFHFYFCNIQKWLNKNFSLYTNSRIQTDTVFNNYNSPCTYYFY